MSERLIGPAGEFVEQRDECRAALEQLSGHDVTQAPTVEQLRGQLGADLADLVLTSARLQDKARRKLGPGWWWVTERSLQQATAWQVAKLKSGWFGDRSVHDLCCGIGGDACQLAQRGDVVAVDSDPLMVALAAANLAQQDPTSHDASVIHGDVCHTPVPPSSAIHLDPDRRSEGSRSTRSEYFQPSWSDVLRLTANRECAVVKLAPATQLDELPAATTHRCWISLQGSVREQSLLVGEAIERAGLSDRSKSAIALDASGAAVRFAPNSEELDVEPGSRSASKPQTLLVDPDAAIRAAGLCESFAARHALQWLGSPAGFLTCEDADRIDQIAEMAVVGRVLWTGACDDRKLRRELRQRGFYPQTVKVRGTDHDPAKLVKRYRVCGEQPITIWIGRAGQRVYAAFTEM